MALREEEMKKILADKLYVGKKVRVEKWTTEATKSREAYQRESRKGIVEGVYKHIFTVRFGDRLEAFRYCQIFEKGGERVILS